MKVYHSLKDLQPLEETKWTIKVQLARKWKDFNYIFHRESGLNILLIDQDVSLMSLYTEHTFIRILFYTFSYIFTYCRKIVCMVGFIQILSVILMINYFSAKPMKSQISLLPLTPESTNVWMVITTLSLQTQQQLETFKCLKDCSTKKYFTLLISLG